MKIDKKDFDLLRKHIYTLCGLKIPDGKEYLIEHRFTPLFKDRGCKSWLDFYELMRLGDAGFRDDVVSAISTHETSFFRDSYPFTVIRKIILPKLAKAKKRGRNIRIWCAAASTGQEPYSLAMLIHDFCNSPAGTLLSPGDFSILATDISGKVLEKASEGVFSDLEISRGLPRGYNKYFHKVMRYWKVNEDVRAMVNFKKFNLLNSFKGLGCFDFVMCRNVLIYFDDHTKLDILHRIHPLLPDNGYLMLGSTETLAGYTDRFTAEHFGAVILYRKERFVGGKDEQSFIHDNKYKKTFSIT